MEKYSDYWLLLEKFQALDVFTVIVGTRVFFWNTRVNIFEQYFYLIETKYCQDYVKPTQVS